jgi:hypothetical protein
MRRPVHVCIALFDLGAIETEAKMIWQLRDIAVQ